ncbi:MAG TPA: hypothetical protein VK893_15350 [Pyrinomonadaceae bacterium]|nr:hypothetical protein [Pyrinomonadaceae bacterium]
MKTCPKCNRTFPDEGQKFCTFDGGLLIAPQTFDPNATIRATSIDLNAAAERPTSRDLPDPNATIIESYPETVALPRNTGPAGRPTTVGGPNTADFSKPAEPQPPATTPPPPSPPPPAEAAASPVPPAPVPTPPSPPAPTAPVTTGPIPPASDAVSQPAPSRPLAPPAAHKKSKAPLIIAGVLLFLLLGGGALAGVFFFVVKPRLDQMAAVNENQRVENSNTNTATPEPTVEQPSPSPTSEDTFVPPPDTAQFTSSKDGLQGQLAEHYFDFSFYYPKGWERLAKPGSQNFVGVERRLPPDFTQENFVVGWYTSTGTFVGDLPSYKERVEEFSTRLAKQVPEYRKVSEGVTKVNSMQGYEFRWEGLSKGTERGDLRLWGRVIFVPTGKEGDTTGATLNFVTTSLAPELSSVEDVGERGQAPVILESFRFGKNN